MYTQVRTWRDSRHWIFALAATSFLTAAFQLAAPLHLSKCSDPQDHAEHKCPDSSDKHRSDNCSVCQFLFGLSGKTLIPELSTAPCGDILAFQNIIPDYTPSVHNLPKHIIPRAPPAA